MNTDSRKNKNKQASGRRTTNGNSPATKKSAGSKSRPRKRRRISGVWMAVIVAAILIFNIVIIVIELKSKGKDDNEVIATEESTDDTAETDVTSAGTTEAVTTEATTEEATTEKEMLKSIREEFPEYSKEEQEKVLYIHQNMHLYTHDMILMLHKNHEALEFIYNYPEDHTKPVVYDISDEMKEAKSGKVPLFLQWDKRWGYMEYGDGLMANNGCGPTCLSMVAVYLTKNKTFTPPYIGKYSIDHDYYVDGHGTAWSLIHTGCEAFGIKSYEVGLSESAMIEAVQNGNPIIACVDEGDFTDGGHFIVLTGYKDGKFTVNDPYSVKNTEKTWDYDRLEGQIAGLWAFYRDESLTTEQFTEEQDVTGQSTDEESMTDGKSSTKEDLSEDEKSETDEDEELFGEEDEEFEEDDPIEEEK
ncbi:MAG: C39 family peptidase [Eubacterium sp.]|nr:C39 family peptidase [Eubacterium sp.]